MTENLQMMTKKEVVEKLNKMKKIQIVSEIYKLIPLDWETTKRMFRGFGKGELIEFFQMVLPIKKASLPEQLFMVNVDELSKECDVCEKCFYHGRTPYGMEYCEWDRRLKRITPEKGACFETTGNDPPIVVSVNVACNQFVPMRYVEKEEPVCIWCGYPATTEEKLESFPYGLLHRRCKTLIETIEQEEQELQCHGN